MKTVVVQCPYWAEHPVAVRYRQGWPEDDHGRGVRLWGGGLVMGETFWLVLSFFPSFFNHCHKVAGIFSV